MVIDIPIDVINHIEREYCQGYKLKNRESVKAWISDLVKHTVIVNYKTSQRGKINKKFINREKREVKK